MTWMHGVRLIFVTFLALVVVYLIFIYDPYSDKCIQKNYILALSCDKEAISYLLDFYEKRNQQIQFRNILMQAEKCGDKNAKHLLENLFPETAEKKSI